jgi:hypothetical protein
MTRQNKIFLAFVLVLAALAVAFVYGVTGIKASVTQDQTTAQNIVRSYELFASTTAETTVATTTAATSTNIIAYANSNGTIVDGSVDVRGAKHVDLYFTRGNAFGNLNSGTTTYAIQGSTDPNGTNWVYVNRLILATSTQTSNFGVSNGVYASDPSGTFTSANQITLPVSTTATGAATTTTHVYIDPAILNFYKIRAIAASIATSSNPSGSAEVRAVVTY